MVSDPIVCDQLLYAPRCQLQRATRQRNLDILSGPSDADISADAQFGPFMSENHGRNQLLAVYMDELDGGKTAREHRRRVGVAAESSGACVISVAFLNQHHSVMQRAIVGCTPERVTHYGPFIQPLVDVIMQMTTEGRYFYWSLTSTADGVTAGDTKVRAAIVCSRGDSPAQASLREVTGPSALRGCHVKCGKVGEKRPDTGVFYGGYVANAGFEPCGPGSSTEGLHAMARHAAQQFAGDPGRIIRSTGAWIISDQTKQLRKDTGFTGRTPLWDLSDTYRQCIQEMTVPWNPIDTGLLDGMHSIDMGTMQKELECFLAHLSAADLSMVEGRLRRFPWPVGYEGRRAENISSLGKLISEEFRTLRVTLPWALDGICRMGDGSAQARVDSLLATFEMCAVLCDRYFVRRSNIAAVKAIIYSRNKLHERAYTGKGLTTKTAHNPMCFASESRGQLAQFGPMPSHWCYPEEQYMSVIRRWFEASNHHNAHNEVSRRERLLRTCEAFLATATQAVESEVDAPPQTTAATAAVMAASAVADGTGRPVPAPLLATATAQSGEAGNDTMNLDDDSDASSSGSDGFGSSSGSSWTVDLESRVTGATGPMAHSISTTDSRHETVGHGVTSGTTGKELLPWAPVPRELSVPLLERVGRVGLYGRRCTSGVLSKQQLARWTDGNQQRKLHTAGMPISHCVRYTVTPLGLMPISHCVRSRYTTFAHWHTLGTFVPPSRTAPTDPLTTTADRNLRAMLREERMHGRGLATREIHSDDDALEFLFRAMGCIARSCYRVYNSETRVHYAHAHIQFGSESMDEVPMIVRPYVRHGVHADNGEFRRTPMGRVTVFGFFTYRNECFANVPIWLCPAAVGVPLRGRGRPRDADLPTISTMPHAPRLRYVSRDVIPAHSEATVVPARLLRTQFLLLKEHGHDGLYIQQDLTDPGMF